MRMPGHDPRQNCFVIPFVIPVANEDTLPTSSIATVIAVTILHREGESPEGRLLDIINASGEAEVLDVEDLTGENEAFGSSLKHHLETDNDNDVIKVF